MDEAAVIVETLERAGTLGGDITPLVYKTLFAGHPELEGFFCNDHDGAVRGEMLAQLIGAILDMQEKDYFGSALIRTLAVNHDGFAIGPDIFPTFADALHQAIRGLLAPDFSPQAEAAWSGLVRRIHRLTHETFTAGAA